MLASCAIVFVASRGKRLYQAAMAALVLVPVFFRPANYYMHLIYLLPLIAAIPLQEQPQRPWWPRTAAETSVWFAPLLLCALQFPTTTDESVGHRFFTATAMLFMCFGAVLLAAMLGQLGQAGVDRAAKGGGGREPLRRKGFGIGQGERENRQGERVSRLGNGRGRGRERTAKAQSRQGARVSRLGRGRGR